MNMKVKHDEPERVKELERSRSREMGRAMRIERVNVGFEATVKGWE